MSAAMTRPRLALALAALLFTGRLAGNQGRRRRMKLTKTETAILEQLEKRGRFTACRASGRGAEGAFKKAGMRQWDAARKLIDKGLAREINRHRETDCRAGYFMHYSTLLIGLPE